VGPQPLRYSCYYFGHIARKFRVEVEGGLYHLIARGNDRQDIFHSPEDHLKFVALLIKEKARSPYFLYAYCLMTNHLHLLLERQQGTIGGIMKRVLGGYSRYYNRRYKHVGHVFQGRHKAATFFNEDKAPGPKNLLDRLW
jgi:REP element-mobilizing transposase RayT